MSPEEFIFKKPIFSSKEFAVATKMRVDAASRKLSSLAKREVIKKVTRGIWINDKSPEYSVYGLVPYLLGPEQGYLSFLSTLHRHDVISQIPQKIFVATTGHGRSLKSSVATFEFLQLKPKYMQHGINWHSGSVSYGIANAEKSLLDCLYVATRKGRKFQNFPELNFSAIKLNRFNQLVKKHQFPKPILKKIRLQFEALRLASETPPSIANKDK